MRRFSHIDNLFCLKHGLTLQEAFVLEWMLQLPGWAETKVINDQVCFFASKNKAVADLPVITDKLDTMYRYYKKLSEKGFIWIYKEDKKDFVHLNPVCHQWNASDKNPSSEEHPSEVGQTSEIPSDKHPTNSNTNSNSKLITDDSVKQVDTLFGTEEVKIQFLPEDVLEYFNQAMKLEFPKRRGLGPTDSNLKDIKARLRDKKVKYKLQDFKTVIDYKIQEWKGQEKTKKWLRPSTLFGEKFDNYLTVALEASDSKDWGNNNFVDAVAGEDDLL